MSEIKLIEAKQEESFDLQYELRLFDELKKSDYVIMCDDKKIGILQGKSENDVYTIQNIEIMHEYDTDIVMKSILLLLVDKFDSIEGTMCVKHLDVLIHFEYDSHSKFPIRAHKEYKIPLKYTIYDEDDDIDELDYLFTT